MSEDEVRLEMVHELHAAMYGSSWARPEPPKAVWEMLLREVRRRRLDSGIAYWNPSPFGRQGAQ